MEIKNFNASDLSVFDFFTKSKNLFYIPKYQRSYNWTFSNEITELIDDLIEFQNDDKSTVYYLGNIIVKPEIILNKKNEEEIKWFSIIDGQQRITTLLLIVNALKLSLIKTKNAKLKHLNSLNEIIFILNDDDEKRRIKIFNNEVDKFMTEIFNLRKIEDASNDLKKTSYFEILNNLVEETFSEIDNDSVEKWIESLKKINIVKISLGKNDNEIKVFESINSKGLTLNTLDKIKNFLYLLAEKFEITEDNKLLILNMQNKLEKIAKNKKKEIDDKLIDRFFAAYIAKISLEDNKKDSKVIYKKFKELAIFKITNKKSFVEFMRDLIFSVEKFEELMDLKNDFSENVKVKNYSLSFLAYSKLEMYLVYFLKMEDQIKQNILSQNEFEQIINLLDFHNVLISLIGYKNSDNRFLFRYFKQQNGNIKFETLLNFLKIENQKNKSSLPTISKLKKSFRETEIYLHDSNIAKYILYRIENFLNIKTQALINFSYTIEHIFSQSEKNWKDKFDNLTYKDSKIHTIGNLTLLKSGWNTSISNDSFENKKTKYIKSNLTLNKLVSDYEDWVIKENDDSTIAWSEYLFEVFVKIWNIDLLEENKNISKLDKVLKLYEKITIIDAIYISIFILDVPSTKNEICKQIENIFDYVEEYGEDFEIKITFKRDKISPNGWFTERLARRMEGNALFEKNKIPLFQKTDDKKIFLTNVAKEEMENKIK